MDLELLTPLILLLLIGGVGLYLRTYVSKKAENLASQEDLAALTDEVERVRHSYRRQEEFYRAELDRWGRSHERMQDFEFETYQKIWKELNALHDHLSEVQSYGLASRGEGTEKHRAAYWEFQDYREKLNKLIADVEPFISPEVHGAVWKTTLEFREIALKSGDTQARTDEEFHEIIQQWVSRVHEARQRLKKAIRERLFMASEDGTPNLLQDGEE